MITVGQGGLVIQDHKVDPGWIGYKRSQVDPGWIGYTRLQVDPRWIGHARSQGGSKVDWLYKITRWIQGGLVIQDHNNLKVNMVTIS